MSSINHINFSLMATTIVWIYGSHIEFIPNRRHPVKGWSSFVFSDLRYLIAKDTLNEDYQLVCNGKQKIPRKSFVDALMRMTA